MTSTQQGPSDTNPLVASHQSRDAQPAQSNSSIAESTTERKWWYGDIKLSPNVGLTNSYDDSICGAIHEIVQQLRTGLVCLTLATLFILFWKLWWHFFTLQWIRLVLSMYLAFLTIVLCISDAILLSSPLFNSHGTAAAHALSSGSFHMYTGDNDDASIGSNGSAFQAPEARRWLEQNFGFVYHPVGRPCLLIFIATLCWNVGGLFMFLGGLVYFAIAGVIIVMGKEPEFRRGYYPEYEAPTQNNSSATAPISWTTLSWTTTGETQSLLGRSSGYAT